jgi:hypothetical protein
MSNQPASMDDPSSSSPHAPSLTVTDPAVAAYIAQLQKQAANMNAEGNRILAELNAEKAKNAQVLPQAVANVKSRTNVKIPLPPPFKGEVGFMVDQWLRHLTKLLDFQAAEFPTEKSRILYAIMFFQGAAMDWWDKIPTVEKDNIVTWEKFVEVLHSRFRPMQAAMLARVRLTNLKQTGAVPAYVNLFLRELTPITDMSTADQIFNFRAGLKPNIAQKVLEKLPKTLHEAMDIAVLADAHTNKMSVPQYNYSSRSTNSGSSASRTGASSSNDMDLSNVNYDNQDEYVKPPVFHEEDGSSSSSSSSSANHEVMREFHRMKSELKKYQAQAEISAISSSSNSTSTGSHHPNRVQVSKEEFDYCFANRLCLKCKKPNHRAVDCRSKYQPLK